jgi:hypothetical protein
MVRVHPPAATPNVRDPFRVNWGGSRRNTHPRSPAPTSHQWVLRDFTRGMASASMGSIFLSSDFLFLLPFLCFPGELRALALLGAPLLPLPSGAPLLPRHPGATGGRRFPPLPLRERGRWSSLHHPPGEAPVGPEEVQEHHPPHPGGHDAAVPRRLSSVPPIPPLAPPGFCPGDWETAAANPGGPVSHEAGRLTSLCREKEVLTFNSSHPFSLYNVKTHKT